MLNRSLSDMNNIGISGVTGVGKFDLAAAYASETDYSLITFDSRKILRRTRAKFTTTGIIEEYLNVLSQLESSYMHASKRFVTDMTPIDVLADMYSTFSWFNEPSEAANKKIDEVWAYSCKIMSQYLSVVMYVQPLSSTARKEHLSAIGAGLIHTRLVSEVDTKMLTVNRKATELGPRMDALKSFVFDQYVQESPCESTSSLHH